MNSHDVTGQSAIVMGRGQGIGLTMAERILASGRQVAIWDGDVGPLAGLMPPE
jgi:NAD(P)-dependent dehydrogenase (short-subunit alcohol dehydrogenase family)